MFVCSLGFKGLLRRPGVQQTSRPPQRSGGWGDGWSELPAVGNPAVLKPSGGRERGAGQSNRLCSAEFPKPLRAGSFTGREGPGPGGHKCTAASRSCPPASPGKTFPPRQAPRGLSICMFFDVVVLFSFACFLPLLAVLVLTTVKD